MNIACLDLEGVLIPEIWIAFSEKTNLPELAKTTRDIPDYDELMRYRLAILEKHDFKLKDIEEVVSQLKPLEGAADFLNQLREEFQVIILSDTFYQFSKPFMRQLGFPALFCHRLEIDDEGKIANYKLRQKDQKREAVKALHGLNFKVFAAGDSYNDTTMLGEADGGILFRPPRNVIEEFPQYPVTTEFDDLLSNFLRLKKEKGIAV